MKVVAVRVEARQWRVHARNAHRRWSTREGRLLVLTDEDGRRGLGEASPLEGYGRETIADVDAALSGIDARLAEPFEDRDLDAQIKRRLEGCASAAGRFGVETALWDLRSQRRGVPLAVAWGASPAARITTARLLDLAAETSWPARAPATIKVKIGHLGRWTEELAAVERLAARFPGVPVRLDANRAFAPEVVGPRLDDLAALARRTGLRIEFVEEPSAGPWPAKAVVPLARDESLWGRRPEASRFDAVAAVLKPTLLGGLSMVRRWAAVAPQSVVSHAFEGPVAHAAAAAAALAVAPDAVAGLGSHAGVTAWPDVIAAHIDDEALVVPAVPGLGCRKVDR